MKRAWSKIRQDKRDYIVSFYSLIDHAYTGTMTMHGSFDNVTDRAIKQASENEYFTLFDTVTNRVFDATDYVTF